MRETGGSGMNTATIRRNNGRRARNSAAKRPKQRKGLIARLVASLPFDERQLHILTTWALGLILLGMLWIAALFFGLPAMLWSETSEFAARAGLRLAAVDVQGAEHMGEQQVHLKADRQLGHSMIDLDLAGLRADIMQLGWVENASVSRRLPDRLVVTIVERKPIAIWQHEGQLNLIDGKGVVLNGVDPRTMPQLPLIVGPDANHQTAALAKLLDAAPALTPLITGATWIGNRRWDIQFNSGETLALPEGESEAAAALVNFARMDGTDRLLGRNFVRFDMRDPSRFVARVQPGRSGGDAGAVPAAAEGTGALPPAEPDAPASTPKGKQG